MFVLPGNVVVEVLPTPEMFGSLYIADRSRFTYHDENGDPIAGFEPSACVVLGVGAGVPLKPGQIVLVYDGDGLCITGAKFGDYRASSEVRIFGIVVPDENTGEPEGLPWEESILAIVEDSQYVMTGSNVLLKRDEQPEATKGGVLLPDTVNDGPTEGTVIGVGPHCADVRVGDRVLYHPLGTLKFYEDPSLRVVREKACLVVIERAVA